MVIFGPTIHTRWNSQNSNLKKELLDYLEALFGVGTFDRIAVARLAGKYLKYTRDTYRTQFQFNPRYELPLTVPESEWKALIHDRKEDKTTYDLARNILGNNKKSKGYFFCSA